MLNKITAQDLSKELQIDLFTVYREYLQLIFLKYFYAKAGSEKVYFKGGTAIRFLMGSFRFSEDLDFTNLLHIPVLENMVKEAVLDMNKEIENVNFKKQKSTAGSFCGKISQTLPYFKFPLTIRLDFSAREKPIHPDTRYIETIFPVSPYPQVSCLGIQELLSEKVRALIIRGKGRDIFDLWFFLSKKIAIDWKLVDEKMRLYKKIIDLKDLISAVKNMQEKDIREDLTRFLPLSQRNLVNNIKDLTLQKLETTIK